MDEPGRLWNLYLQCEHNEYVAMYQNTALHICCTNATRILQRPEEQTTSSTVKSNLLQNFCIVQDMLHPKMS